MWSQTDNDSNSDVKIIAGIEPDIKEFNAHSSVLRPSSLYFQRALSERWKDKKNGVYIITKPNIHPNIFMLILDYIYTGNNILNSSPEESLNILVASDELELLDLAECAQKRLIENFSPWLFSNLVNSLNVVCHHNHFHEVYNHVLNFTFRNPYSLFDSVNLHLLDEKPYFSKTSNSFIFSFTDQLNPVLSKVKNGRKNKAIWNDESCGACFGESDLCMKFDFWTSKWENYEHRITSSRHLYVEEYEKLIVKSGADAAFLELG
ncbi:45693_t:CDS:2 [Gigaspora margarita]|uniref:45693_t:CDS:1 n=1 Tax=Gigaspora margarita TaxID=4874 RepID=A0ABM8W1N5_GIGMA|nr:45693_t:CDS:2 [Gigaspora margarita]